VVRTPLTISVRLYDTELLKTGSSVVGGSVFKTHQKLAENALFFACPV
jgi:hypothetical protein